MLERMSDKYHSCRETREKIIGYNTNYYIINCGRKVTEKKVKVVIQQVEEVSLPVESVSFKEASFVISFND